MVLAAPPFPGYIPEDEEATRRKASFPAGGFSGSGRGGNAWRRRVGWCLADARAPGAVIRGVGTPAVGWWMDRIALTPGAASLPCGPGHTSSVATCASRARRGCGYELTTSGGPGRRKKSRKQSNATKEPYLPHPVGPTAQ
jgi:hypothetical protein